MVQIISFHLNFIVHLQVIWKNGHKYDFWVEVAAIWDPVNIDVIVMMDLMLYWVCLSLPIAAFVWLQVMDDETQLLMKLYCSV